MLFYRFLAGAKQWELHGFPDVSAPQNPRDALRDLAGEGRLEHEAGVAAYGRGDVQGAREHLERGLAAELDPELLNDLGVLLHATGELDRARTVLEMCVLVAPEHAVARENLARVMGDLSPV
jgi:Flp pilus assembly protein TadD